jgi:small-conductance mechanosensitive channel
LSRKPKGRDEALEAIDFIINVLKQHEKDLDRLIAQLAKVTNKITNKGELPERVETMEQQLTTLQTEINNLIQVLSTTKEEKAPTRPTPVPAPQLQPSPVAQSTQLAFTQGPPVIVRCKQWQDFKTLAQNAETVSFLYKETEKTFQADALKQNRVYTYNGETPKNCALLRIWLANELQIKEGRVFEGVLAIG